MKLLKPTLCDAPEVSGSRPPPHRPALQQQFVKNVHQQIFVDFLGRKLYDDWLYDRMTLGVARATNRQWSEEKNLAAYVGDDFDACLKAVEACYEVLRSNASAPMGAEFDQILLDLIKECCQELNLRWESGHFVSS